MGVNLEAPDHTTLSRRSRSLNVDLHRVAGDKPIHLAVDSIQGDIESLTADGAYYTLAIYDASATRGTEVIIRPSKRATRSRQQRSRSSARDRTILRIKEVGRRQWKNESGYHQQARVENTFFRHNTIVGPRLRARHPGAQEAEAVIACNVLNRMTDLGMPESLTIGT
jgi:hypothetical protein